MSGCTKNSELTLGTTGSGTCLEYAAILPSADASASG